MKRLFAIGWALLVLLAFSSTVSAQAVYGGLVGNVTDSSGAGVPGATVAGTHTETNQTRVAVTAVSGTYSMPNLPPGTYTVTITMPGFATMTFKNIAVSNRDTRVDAKLDVATVAETVSVSATAAILQTENAAVSSTTTAFSLQTLPTSGRSFASFLTTMPGVAQPDYQQSGGINNPGRTMSVAVNGQPATNTVVRLDGVIATNQYFESIQSYGPSLEAIEQVNVVSSTFDADQGMAGGAAVNVQVKSGTNQLKGSAFEYGVDGRLRNRDYFLPATQSKGQSSTHIYGGTLGGPIVKNKLFFFASMETTRQRTRGGTPVGQIGTTGFVSLPTQALRNGNFAGTNTVLYDPLTGDSTGRSRTPFAFANCPGLTVTTGAQFDACNYIPADRINAISARILSNLPQPTLPGLTNNYFVTAGYDTTYSKVDAKLTYSPGPKLNLNVRLGFLPSWEQGSATFPAVDGSSFNPIAQGRRWDSFVNSHSVSATSVLSQTWVVDGTFGYTKHNVHVFPPEGQCAGEILGLKNACQPPNSLDTAIPNMAVAGWLLNGASAVRDYVDPQWSVNANAAWQHRSHSVRFGIDYANLAQNHYETQVQDFTFNGGSTALNGGSAVTNFNRFADFLLGMPSARSAQAMTPLIGQTVAGASRENNTFRPATLRNWNTGMYVRDQFQLSSKITVSAGLRWEYYSLPARADHGIEVYDFAQNKLLICGVGPNSSNCGITVEKNLFSPRVGIAYRPTESLVIRAGYSRNPQSNNPGRQQLPPSQAYPQTVVITQSAPNNFSSIGSLNDGSPIPPILDLSSGVISLPAGAGVNTFRDSYVRGRISSWNVTAQKALGLRSSVQIGYVANRQNDLTRNQNLNYGQIGGGSASQPFQKIGITSAMNVYAAIQDVKYDSMQLSYSRRMSGGLQFTGAYTYSKTYDNWASSIAIPEYWDLNYGETGLPHRFNASAVYELPFGGGRRWLNGNGILPKLAGGYQLNAFVTWLSGSLVNATSNNNLNAPGTTAQRADKVKDGPVTIFGDVGTTAQYFDVSAFRPVTALRFGNAGLGSFRGPSAPNLDLSVFRTLRVHGSSTLQLRVEIFNVTNTPHFGNPNATISNATFAADGTITALNGVGSINNTVRTGRQYDERELRIGARFAF